MCLGYWISFVSEKGREAIEGFLNKGVYQVEKLKEEGWITNIFYDDEVQISLEPLLSWKSIYVNNFNNFLWAQMSFCFCFCFFFFLCNTLINFFNFFLLYSYWTAHLCCITYRSLYSSWGYIGRLKVYAYYYDSIMGHKYFSLSACIRFMEASFSSLLDGMTGILSLFVISFLPSSQGSMCR